MHAVKARPGAPLEWLAERIANADRSECWEWPFARSGHNYGFITPRGRRGGTVAVHRFVLEYLGAEIPAGSFVCHKCDNPPCCNPDHLFVGTPQDNARDMVAKGRGVDNKGERHGMSKLTADDVRSIRRDSRIQRVIAADFGINQQHVSEIKRGVAWGWLS